MTTLSERIEQILKERPDLGQSGIVEASGASKSVVNQWLDGKIKSMRLDYALKIEQKLGYDHVWLVLGEGYEMIRRTKDWPFSVSQDLFMALPPEERLRVDKQLAFMVNEWHNQPKSKKAS
ncbi:transcriptional regulator [Herbaspirillum sp. RV1423]|uniref:transcriptional regulator n=1 Tax=Herbaspirillum sp. RV1423 TaxID=1443993 RepID=UPI000687A63F|nr:transcriptional regulator [Herbaspirillum sp. RV1423]